MTLSPTLPLKGLEERNGHSVVKLELMDDNWQGHAYTCSCGTEFRGRLRAKDTEANAYLERWWLGHTEPPTVTRIGVVKQKRITRTYEVMPGGHAEALGIASRNVRWYLKRTNETPPDYYYKHSAWVVVEHKIGNALNTKIEPETYVVAHHVNRERAERAAFDMLDGAPESASVDRIAEAVVEEVTSETVLEVIAAIDRGLQGGMQEVLAAESRVAEFEAMAQLVESKKAQLTARKNELAGL